MLVALCLTVSTSLAMAADAAPQAGHRQAKDTAAKKIKLVDINSAKKAELKTLPGVNDELADKIISARPYLSKAHLLTRNVVTDDIYAGLRALVIARPATSSASKSIQK